MDKLIITGTGLDIATFARVAKDFDIQIELSDESLTKIKKCRAELENILASGKIVYGINTGFGSLSNVKIDDRKLADLQRNLIRSHTAGCGELLPREVVRGAMILRLNTLALGHSGVRVVTAGLICDMLNAGIYPRIPKFGSVGASGDLALLSAMALAMIEDEDSPHQPMVDVLTDGNWETMKSADALKLKGLAPITLASKEGIALNNGCQVSASVAGLALDKIAKAVDANLVTTALTMQALEANTSPLDSRIHGVRPHPGQARVAKKLTELLEGSGLVDTPNTAVQNAYSIRCYPQVAGSCGDLIAGSMRTVEIEMNSATDNPLLFDGTPISGGNFHGAPLAHACDVAVIGSVDLASITERRVYRLVTGSHSGLPSFLTNDPGLSSGFMIAQYTCANLVSHAKSLSFPGSVDSIPTCENQEDHVSMAPVSAYKLSEIADILVSVTAIELLTACQAVKIKSKSAGWQVENQLSKSTANAYNAVVDAIPAVNSDVPLTPLIERMKELIESGMMGT